ncbi:hypothetical protein [Streptomyces sp. NPDC059076]|uniref:hypothetical protein n=1 Tax=unclassified Streptomyces TaxID=2593676 RepID=UPI0036AFC286
MTFTHDTHYQDRHGDTWRAVDTGMELVSTTGRPDTIPPGERWWEDDAQAVERDFGPLTAVDVTPAGGAR